MREASMREALQLTKALADTQRLRILVMLEPGELCVCQIVEVLALAPSTVSKHLSILSAASLVACRKEGRWAYYRLADASGSDPAPALLRWALESLQKDAVVARDRKQLKTMAGGNLEDLCRRQRQRGVATAGATAPAFRKTARRV